MGVVSEEKKDRKEREAGAASCAATTEVVAARSILLRWGAAVLRPYLGGERGSMLTYFTGTGSEAVVGTAISSTARLEERLSASRRRSLLRSSRVMSTISKAIPWER